MRSNIGTCIYDAQDPSSVYSIRDITNESVRLNNDNSILEINCPRAVSEIWRHDPSFIV